MVVEEDVVSLKALEDSLGEVERVLATMAQLRGSRPEGWRKAYVALRRASQAAVQQSADAAEACFRAGLGCANEAEFRSALNGMRSTVAYHQASWPVVVVDLDNPEYRAALQEVVVSINLFREVAGRLVSSIRNAA